MGYSPAIRLDSTVVRDTEDLYQTVNIPSSGVETNIIRLQTRCGFKSVITGFANAVSAGGENVIEFILRVNGVRQYPYNSNTNQISDPALIERLPKPIPFEQGALVEVWARITSGSTAYDATSRVLIEYQDFRA